MTGPTAHRVTWFVPDRPVDGTTVHIRQDPPGGPSDRPCGPNVPDPQPGKGPNGNAVIQRSEGASEVHQ